MTDRGSLTVRGIGDSYRPGAVYDMGVTLQSEHLKNGGFQMTAQFEDGSQAGKFEWESGRLRLTPSISDTVQYLQHTREGTVLAGRR